MSQIKGLTALKESYKRRAENIRENTISRRSCGSPDYKRATADILEEVYHDLEELLK